MASTAAAAPDRHVPVGDRRQLIRLCAAGSLAYGSYAMCRSPLLPLLARDLGADAPTVGLVVGASTITGIVLKLPAGAWSDVLGRRPLLLAGALVFAVLPFTYLGLASLLVLLLTRFVHGSATAIFGPVASASLSDIAPPHRRGTWLSTYSTMQGAGQALGPVIAGYLLMARGYDAVFVAAGLTATAVPFIVAGWPVRADPAPPSERRGAFARGIREVMSDRRILVTSAAQAAHFVLHGALSAFLPLFAGNALGLSVAQVGWLFGVQTLTTLAVRPLIGAVSDRIGRRSAICVGLVICSAAVLFVSMAGGLSTLVAAVLLYAAGVAVTSAAAGAYITDLSRRARYGAAHGVFGTIYDIGDALGPIAAGVLVAVVGYARMFQLMALVPGIAAVAFYLLSRDPAVTRRA